MMGPIIILKGQGAWFDGHHMLSREELQQLADELGMDVHDINPFHVDPRTKTFFDENEYEVLHGYEGLMRKLAEKLEPVFGGDKGKAKMYAIKLLNQATEDFNNEKPPGDPHRIPIPFDKHGNLHPSYKRTHYSESFQKHPKRDSTLDVEPGEGAQRVHPAHRRTHVKDSTGKPVLATRTLSNQDNPDLGEMIEADEFHPAHHLRELMRKTGLERHYPADLLRGEVINPRVMVKPRDGSGVAWNRYHTNQDPTSILHGGAIPKNEKVHRDINGEGYHIIRALASLHPMYFKRGQYQSKVSKERENILRMMFGDSEGNVGAGLSQVLQNLSMTAIGELLSDSYRGFADRPTRDARPARSKGSGLARTTNLLLSSLGVPTGPVSQGTPESDAKRHFDLNADHILLEMSGIQHARKPLSRALYASLLSYRQGESMSNPLKEQFMSHFPNSAPIHPDQIKDIPVTSDMGPKFREKPITTPPRQEFAQLDEAATASGGVAPGGVVGVRGPLQAQPFRAGSNIIRRSEE